MLAEEVSEGGSGEATLEGVDRGEDRGDVNIGMPSLVGLVSPCTFAILNLEANLIYHLTHRYTDEREHHL